MRAHLRPYAPLLLLLLAACQSRLDLDLAEQGGPTVVPSDRLPAFAGADPDARGWVEVRGLFWVRAAERERWERGEVFDGKRWWPRSEAPAPPGAAIDGTRIRTAHVSLLTNVAWPRAERVARQAQRHVERLYATYADDLDFRFPNAPLRVVLHRRRLDFRYALEQVAPGHYGWAAFYDANTGAVHVSAEPAPAGALPLLADLRHEMTHQILDRSRPPKRRGIPRTHLWLWEGFAVYCESLGDPLGTDVGTLRLERHAVRRARDEVESLTKLMGARHARLEGRHYDQLASLMRFLMADGLPGSRRAVLETLREVLRGRDRPAEFLRRIGRTTEEIEAAWLAG